MIRTQIYLPKELYQNLNLTAKKESKTRAQVIREALIEGLRKKRGNAAEALLELASLGKKFKLKGPKDLSQNIDKYLYENE
ncbi:MAG: hypothetical protein A3H82_00750 [Candidatus Levybacteria bacterium RIFCSPLOWO2_02_FULL_39_26]|uniref:Ribbon-helix-helix protein CopG domain-containing protein n=1 Tax=Candidatus Daviesbacteria bacterium RIFCSPHIGHO2_12_FULL_43_11 TaxID=1797780 RepID=A0A1F5K3H6_9BACT|nr:MAG: hypothetical protein A3E45_00105 [Candidatus Daviesbacteria bacterium RIFCSPHIGHO2_12_FULL_43_11]OGH45160.1 MAG: hypothetical protein A3H82_00750 [Candidatus Levybacteria bacterium RIFCSPLOWO2_02_FULL_39_26]